MFIELLTDAREFGEVVVRFHNLRKRWLMLRRDSAAVMCPAGRRQAVGETGGFRGDHAAYAQPCVGSQATPPCGRHAVTPTACRALYTGTDIQGDRQ